jgi:hypothetical protein
MKMITEILQVTGCIALATAALYWKFTRSTQQGAHKFLFPFIIAAGVLGIALIAPYAIELFVASYSGAIYESAIVSFRFNGPYWWVYYCGFIFPLLPTFGVIPIIGSRPVVVAFLAVIALIPVLFTPTVGYIRRITKKAEQVETQHSYQPPCLHDFSSFNLNPVIAVRPRC